MHSRARKIHVNEDLSMTKLDALTNRVLGDVHTLVRYVVK